MIPIPNIQTIDIANMAIPNIQTIDIANIRENSPKPTTDVKFSFVDQNSGEKLELNAHKLILAFGSEVFMSQFFGSMRDERDTIPVEDASFDAFKTFLDVIYNRKMSLGQASFKLLAELYSLADKYLMPEMQEFIIQEVNSRNMASSKELIEAAKVVEENAHIEKFSESIVKISSTFVKENIESVFEVFHSEESGSANSHALHRLLGRFSQKASDVCNNCKQTPCLQGKVVTEDNLVQNAEVRFCGGVQQKQKGGFQAVVKESDDLVAKCIILGSYHPSDSSVKLRDISGFQYACY